MDLKLYFDGAQNQNMTEFERIITQVLSKHKEARVSFKTCISKMGIKED